MSFIIALLALLVLAAVLILNLFQTTETYIMDSQPIHFMSKDELLNLLLSNEDNYYNSMYANDLKARESYNLYDYLNKINYSVSEINDSDKNRLSRLIDIIDRKIFQINSKWFDISKFNQIPWKIGFITGDKYESGLPHTRKDTIILSKEIFDSKNDSDVIKTLLHEKVHIYQRYNPEQVDIYLNLNGFTKYKKRCEEDMIRCNPDTDEWIYKDNNNNEHKAVYTKSFRNIKDVHFEPCNSQKCEHPFEKMAIELSNMI